MKRIAILGCCGAGKSTLASKLGHRLNIPVIHLDAHYWLPGWVESDETEWRIKQKSLLESDRWITDGNYSRTLDLRIQAADTIIYLDFPRYLCLWRIFKRYFGARSLASYADAGSHQQYRGTTRPDMAQGCPERLNWDFLVYVWQFRVKQRKTIFSKLELLKDEKTIMVLQPSQLNSFLANIA